MIFILVFDIATADAADRKRYRRLIKLLAGQGVRVQKSVFEFSLHRVQMLRLIEKVRATVDQDRDAVRVFSVGTQRGAGKQPPLSFGRPWII